MRILIAPQEFKGSLSAVEAADCFAAAARELLTNAEIDLAPLADGGPGTVEAIVRAAQGRSSIARVSGPFGAPVDARWGRIDDGRTAVIEMAAAAGLTLLAPQQLDPRRASTYGVGELILHALEARTEQILIGVGGSATNDGGAGAAVALGARLLDDDARPLPPGGAALAQLARIDAGGLDPRLAATTLEVLCDVQNPLLGADGASTVYGPQKGADAQAVAELDRALANYAGIMERDLGVRITDLSGAGAAGGLPAALVACCGARLVSGFDAVAAAIGLAERVARADIVLTGEGRLDTQSAWGKSVAGIAQLAQAAGRPCIAVCGLVEGDAELPGLSDREQATPTGIPVEHAMAEAASLATDAVRRAISRWI